MIEYPKIETAFVRDERTRCVLPDQLRLPEFGIVRSWAANEKVDGTNIRVGREGGKVCLAGRTDNAQFSVPAMDYLRGVFTAEALARVFPEGDDDFVLFGELYGPKIQKGGDYAPGLRVRLFDVKVGFWWLKRDDVAGIALALGIAAVPELGIITGPPRSRDDMAALIDVSRVAMEDGGAGCYAEGIVARSEPLLLLRNGQRLMWKLKFRDFGGAP
jgi:hypothetical protein